MKRLWCLLSVLTLSVALTGCGVEVSEEDNRVIAEYAADLLLKYDKNYQSPLEEELDTEPTTEETDTESSVEPSSEEAEQKTTATEEGEAEPSTASADEVTDLAPLFGLDGIAITFRQCQFVDQYPSTDQTGAFITLEAEEGYKLAVVEFDLVNQTDQDQEVDLLHKTVNYQIIMNDSREARPMLTILMEDLGTYENIVPADNSQTAVLVFQVSDQMAEQVESMKLRITYENEAHLLHIQ